MPMQEPKLKSTNPKDRIGITKVPLHLCPLSGQIHEALALLDGACKYGLYNWRSENVAASVYVAACLRHVLKWYNGRDKDNCSGVHELGHAKACLSIVLDAEESDKLVDDRPPADRSPELLDKYADEVVRILTMHGKLEPVTPTFTEREKPDTDFKDLPTWAYGETVDELKASFDAVWKEFAEDETEEN